MRLPTTDLRLQRRLYGTSTKVGPTNVGRYKSRTVQTSDLQTSDWYKRRTCTYVGPVQTSDEKNIGLWLSLKKNIAIRNKPKLCYCDNNRRQLNTVLSFEGSTSSRKQQTKKDQKGVEFNCHKL